MTTLWTIPALLGTGAVVLIFQAWLLFKGRDELGERREGEQ